MEDKKFWRNVEKKESGCWEWRGGKDKKGYGIIRRRKVCPDKSIWFTHRYVWYLTYGYMPNSDNFICHKCDNPPCVNPEHLFMGTIQDNTADMVQKNRQFYGKGNLNGNAVLTEQDVVEIRKIGNKYSNREIGEMFGVTGQLIGQIQSRKIWTHI